MESCKPEQHETVISNKIQAFLLVNFSMILSQVARINGKWQQDIEHNMKSKRVKEILQVL